MIVTLHFVAFAKNKCDCKTGNTCGIIDLKEKIWLPNEKKFVILNLLLQKWHLWIFQISIIQGLTHCPSHTGTLAAHIKFTFFFLILFHNALF